MLLTKNSGIALEAKAVGEDGTFEGYGSIFGNVDSYGEIVEPGAFTASLVAGRKAGQSVKLLWQHDPAQPIGVWSALAEDSKGLYVKGRLLIGDGTRAGVPQGNAASSGGARGEGGQRCLLDGARRRPAGLIPPPPRRTPCPSPSTFPPRPRRSSACPRSVP